MLLELHIKNFALIDNLDVEFFHGLNILTGETGAGKSILIDSVGFILGEKQSRDIIRVGQNTAFVEAIFDMDGNGRIVQLLRQNGILDEDEDEADKDTDSNMLIISREINKNGRSVSRINGRTVTLGVLREIGAYLLDIHGQHEHQSLLDESSHIEILDSFCDLEFRGIKDRYSQMFRRLKEIDRQLEDFRADEQTKLRKIDLLRFQINDIADAKLSENEDEDLNTRRDVLTNSEKIYGALNGSFQNLNVNEEDSCAYDKIGSSIAMLEHIEKYDTRIKEINDMLNDVYFKLEDIVERIRNYRDGIEYDQNELDAIEARLDVISKLKRKYGSSIQEIMEYCSRSIAELELLEQSGANIERLTAERAELHEQIMEATSRMTASRKHTAHTLKLGIEKELKYLGMDKAIFQIYVEALEELDENGADRVSFNISANPGEPPKPLVKVASGGEMSRIMLAIKNVIADIDQIPTLIFDEIDTGISGRTAQAVAEKMVQISTRHQLLCVTHLPQIAAMADHHFKIEKHTDLKMEKTSTTVCMLDQSGQIDELSRMLGGAEVTALTREHASEMLKLAHSFKIK